MRRQLQECEQLFLLGAASRAAPARLRGWHAGRRRHRGFVETHDPGRRHGTIPAAARAGRLRRAPGRSVLQAAAAEGPGEFRQHLLPECGDPSSGALHTSDRLHVAGPLRAGPERGERPRHGLRPDFGLRVAAPRALRAAPRGRRRRWGQFALPSVRLYVVSGAVPPLSGDWRDARRPGAARLAVGCPQRGPEPRPEARQGIDRGAAGAARGPGPGGDDGAAHRARGGEVCSGGLVLSPSVESLRHR
mmetsp:Transcript_74104/g.240954  ORF Transcript_74104/g.240954 Transcript_74104/m.240954 type:complete len:247 (+) Transcript_74104:651-1391(+)